MFYKKVIWKKGGVEVGELKFKKGKKIIIKEFIELKRKVVIIVPLEEDYVYLLREYRPLLKKTVWRVAAGTLKMGETSKKAAERELSEETGLKAGNMKLVRKYEYMGWVKFPFFIFRATKLKRIEQKLDFYEKIKVIKVSREKAVKIALNEMEEPHHAFALLKVLKSK
jgi:ADP-ribose pyrophosphatase